MSLDRRSDQRPVPVRLCDVPLGKRMSAAARICKKANEKERADIFMAALAPSEKVYWVAAA